MSNLLPLFRWRMRRAARLLSPLLSGSSGDQEPRRLMCLISGGLGDRLMSLPALRRLNQLYPRARMHVVWLDGSLEVVSGEFSATTSHGRRRWPAMVLTALRGWDICFVNTQGVFSVLSEWCALLSRAPVRIGPGATDRSAEKTVYTRVYEFRHDEHATATNLRAIDPRAGNGSVPYPVTVPPMPAPTPARTRIALHPGVGRGYAIKQWPVAHWRECIVRLHAEFPCDIIVVAGPGEEGLGATITDSLPASVARVLTLTALFRTVESCQLLVAPDSGPAHVAAAVGVPAIVLFGPTNPVRVAPVGDRVRVIAAPCESGPCFDTRERCIRQTSCMASLPVDAVLQAADEFLDVSG